MRKASSSPKSNNDPNRPIWEHLPGHPLAYRNGVVLQHRRIWYDAYGPIPPGFAIRHLNGIRNDNRLENLILIKFGTGEREEKVSGIPSQNGICLNPECEKPFEPKRSWQKYCSDKCARRGCYIFGIVRTLQRIRIHLEIAMSLLDKMKEITKPDSVL